MKGDRTMQLLKPFRILLIGDNCKDEYQFGTVERISPEAPVPVFNFNRTMARPGMAGNVEANLKALGCEVDFLRTQQGTKIRLIDERSFYHIVRIDHDINCDPVHVDPTKTDYDAVVISDYNKGTVTYETIDLVQNNFTCPIFIDTKKTDAKRFSKCFLKINETEFENLTSYTGQMIITKGDKPVEYNNNGTIKFYEVPHIGVHDVCGAGDTFLAALAYGYLSFNNMGEAIELAVKASQITLQYLGTHAPSIEEILANKKSSLK